MKLRVRSELVYRFDPPTDAIFQIHVARWPGQRVLEETLVISPGADSRLDETVELGTRPLRARLSGEVTVIYQALVDNGRLKGVPPGAVQHDWADLPVEVLTYLWPSRYCPSDLFGRFSEREFGTLSGGARVLAIVAWIAANVDYRFGVSDSETTAARTFIDRAGVCRDFTHLGITLCRAAGIPARAVSAYADQLTPPDFHAVFEVWLSNGWWLIDPTGLAPITGLVRIASGHDAADIAFLSTQGACEMVRQAITVEAV
jgi:transglutaminase-like putative cysteine protease